MAEPVGWDFQAIDALIELVRTNQVQARRIVRAIRLLSAENHGDVKKLRGRDQEWRLRVGDWRVIFTRLPVGIEVVVLRIELRRDAYD